MSQSVIHPNPSPPNSTITTKFYSSSPNRNKRLLLSILSTIVICFFIITTSLIVTSSHSPLVSPLGTRVQKILGLEDTPPSKSKVIYGFLPYWNFKLSDTIPYHHLTHLALFGIAFDSEGHIQTREEDYAEPGWRNMTNNTSHIINQAKQANVKTIVVLRGFNNEMIESIISSPLATDTLIQETLAFVDLYNYDGINLDFEYQGEPSLEIRDQFTKFVETLSTRFRSHSRPLHFSIDVYADSVSDNRIWDLTTLGPLVDHIIIMAYDFYRPSSSQAGPVAPLYGSNLLWTHDITSLLAQHLQLNSPYQILLGIPFYGYEWRTTTTDYLSSTYKRTGSLATYKRIQSVLSDKSLLATRNWSDQALSPWLTYRQGNTIWQIHYDDVESLALKFDLVNQTDLSGIAIWALGYEGNAPEIWNLISQKFTQRSQN